MPTRERRWRLRVPVDAARRKFLFAFGLAFAGIGSSYVFADMSTPVRRVFWWTDPVPFWSLGVVWVICGILAIVSSFGPTPRDKYGFVALSIPASLWAICYGVAGIIHVIDPDYYAPRAFVSLFVFGLITFAVDTVSGMVSAEHQHTAPPNPPTERTEDAT